tara:strand:+ start:271 stop:555 length:285 start_codon:yes stop_codon:yes gene_type:complete
MRFSRRTGLCRTGLKGGEINQSCTRAGRNRPCGVADGQILPTRVAMPKERRPLSGRALKNRPGAQYPADPAGLRLVGHRSVLSVHCAENWAISK